MIVLDTNVLSELMKPKPATKVIDWMATQPAARLYTTSITQAEPVSWERPSPLGTPLTSMAAA